MSDGVTVTSRIELEGNFFTHVPGDTLYANIGHMLDELADEMETAVRADIAGHAGSMPFYTGWSWAHTEGRRSGRKHWATWAAVQAYTGGMDAKDAIRTKAAAASIERRWHPYRRVRSAVYRSRAVLSANLARNLE